MDAAQATFETLHVRVERGVLHATLNRAAARNAMSLRMVDELLEMLAGAEGRGDVRAIVLRGAGGHFCAGADLKDMAAARQREAGGEADAVAAANARFGALCAAFSRTGLATIAVLEGAVMGGGLGLACVADVVLAGASAQLRLPETTLGLVPAQIAPFLVERIGAAQTRRLAVTGARLSAAQALAIGLVHEVHDDAPPASSASSASSSPADDAAQTPLDAALARTLAAVRQCAPGAVAATKALIARARHTPAAELVDEAARVFAAAARGAEGMEGAMSFLQKRPPAWATE
jgi:isohexenylglutaconyl-CoA hydratase